MSDEEIIKAFHLMWGNFPEAVMITQKNREIVAVNETAEKFGLKPGIKCSSIGKPENHKGCQCNKAIDTGKVVSCTYEGNFGKAYGFWIPITEKPEWVIHFGVGYAFEYEKISRGNGWGGNFVNEKVVAGLQVIVTELSQQADGHLIQSRIFAAQGLNKLAKQYEEHAAEERGYVVKCIDRLIDLGCEVKLEEKHSAPICKDAEEFLKHDLQVSKDGLKWLSEIVKESLDDLTSFEILSDYYKDEEKDMYWTEQQLELISLIGKQNWLAKQI